MNCSKPGTLFLKMLCTLFLAVNSSSAQVHFKIYLVGDAGDHKEAGTTLKNVQKELINNPNSAVIFLGDNSYKDILWGIIPMGFKGFDSSRNTIEKVSSQLNLLENYKGYAFFIPGNHDWWNRSNYEKGKRKLAVEENFIEENLKKNPSIANPDNVFLPKHGDYGPEYVELNHQTIRIVFIDTYRIIQPGIKKNKNTDEENRFYERLDSTIKNGYMLHEKVLVVAHHPVHVAGPYNNPLKHPYLFARIKASSPDFPSFKLMITKINSILQKYPGIYYASGHAHTLQYFYTKDSIHYIISGAGSKERMISEKEIKKYNESMSPNEYLLWNSGGFFEIDFNGETISTILYYDDGLKKHPLSDKNN
jgi:DNA repair exonuclease SbcCD nuclease subunit